MTFSPCSLQLEYFMPVALRGRYHHKSIDNKSQIFSLEISTAKSKDQSLFGRDGRIVHHSESRSRAECKETVCPALPTLQPTPRTVSQVECPWHPLDTPEPCSAQDQKKRARRCVQAKDSKAVSQVPTIPTVWKLTHELLSPQLRRKKYFLRTEEERGINYEWEPGMREMHEQSTRTEDIWLRTREVKVLHGRSWHRQRTTEDLMPDPSKLQHSLCKEKKITFPPQTKKEFGIN